MPLSGRRKFLVWKDLLDQAAVDGASRVLDIGCGRGAVLTLVAGHLTTRDSEKGPEPVVRSP
jgi:ubiquinone/menaquinone biosynthesis C-methylase UbiE